MNENEIIRILLQARLRLQVSIWAVVRDGHTVDDIFQEVMIRALERRDDYGDESHLLAWVNITARNLAIDGVRRKQRDDVLLDPRALDAVCAISKEESDHLAANRDALQWCLEKLPAHSRSVLRLRYGEGLRGSRIAERLNHTLDAVYQRLSRIHRGLRRCVKDRLARDELGSRGAST